nr:aminoacyl-histidine dipeptidase [uncultured Oscillibacter sp.]
MAVLSGLEPRAVFEYFEELCSVPHGSGDTKRISDLCVGVAKELGLRWRQDEHDNVIIWKEASPGCEGAAPVILQGHIDMVCVKEEGCAKDMAAEGVDLRTDGEWVWAERTSLGGDNGAAVAMILAVLADGSLVHPPLEAVFTADEEVGLVGASRIDCSDLKGRKLINLDSEEEGAFTVSCAGGVQLDGFLPGTRTPLEGEAGYALVLDGLLGGHSGAEIHKGRASANQVMIRALYGAMARIPGLRLADVRGGEFDNVICSKSEAKIAVPADRAGEFEAFVREFGAALRDEYRGCDDGIALTCERTALDRALPREATEGILRTMLAVPQGVQAMSADFPGLVQTSLNLGVVDLREDGLHLSVSVRSCIASQKEMLVQRMEAVMALGGGTLTRQGDYPGWQYDRGSALLKDVLAVYQEVCGREGTVQATHGGLECGLFIEKLPGLDAVSFGPEIHGAHSVKERLSVASTRRVYEVVRALLERESGSR